MTVMDPPVMTAPRPAIGKRYKIRFPDKEAYWAAQASEAADVATKVRNPERCVLSVAIPTEGAFVKSFDRSLEIMQERYGAEIVDEFRYDLEEVDIFDRDNFGPAYPDAPSLDDVLHSIEAQGAWEVTRGTGVTIAIVDTGINGSRKEFPQSRRVGSWQPEDEQPWTDYDGHGTMCATIAAASRDEGAEFEGVAPAANLIACRSSFYDVELTAIYQFLRDRARAGELIVASNSFGIKTGSAPPPPDVDFIDALREAIDAGVFAVFSAGNNHLLAGGGADSCSPTTIWSHKCREDVTAVATCKLDRTMWDYSSRGPGEHYGAPGQSRKPDVIAPTPRGGRILYGDEIVTLPLGWGTSGACPQVAGLAALLRSKKPQLRRNEIQDAIRNTTEKLPVSWDCSGSGLVNCSAALGYI